MPPKSQHNYTIAQLEEIVANHSLSYLNSGAFRSCLTFVKQTNYPMYKDMIYKEAVATGKLI